MNILLALAFLFYIGAQLGWILEFLYRNFITHSGPKGRIFINPGLCKGPYLPIYGVGLVIMFLITSLIEGKENNPILIIILIGIVMTIIEFIGGYFLLKFLNIRLWDYTNMKFNIMGLICPQYSFIWTFLGAIYFLFIHEYAYDSLAWLSNNLAFSFFIGLFFGVFLLDLISSLKIVATIKKFGDEHNVVVYLEELKYNIQIKAKNAKNKLHFLNQTFLENTSLNIVLTEIKEHEKELFIFKKKK